VGLALGAAPGFVTPVAWLLALVALGFVSARRMARLEL